MTNTIHVSLAKLTCSVSLSLSLSVNVKAEPPNLRDSCRLQNIYLSSFLADDHDDTSATRRIYCLSIFLGAFVFATVVLTILVALFATGRLGRNATNLGATTFIRVSIIFT